MITRKNLILLTLLAGSAQPQAHALEAPIPSNSRMAMEQLQDVLKSEEDLHVKLDKEMINFTDVMSKTVISAQNKNLDDELDVAQSRVIGTQKDLTENHLRLDFLNTLINSFQSSSGGDLRQDTCNILKDLAHKQLLSATEINQPDGKIWLFEIYLCLAVRDVMEPGEQFGEFVQKFMIYSTLRDPKSPTEFLNHRNYLSH